MLLMQVDLLFKFKEVEGNITRTTIQEYIPVTLICGYFVQYLGYRRVWSPSFWDLATYFFLPHSN